MNKNVVAIDCPMCSRRSKIKRPYTNKNRTYNCKTFYCVHCGVPLFIDHRIGMCDVACVDSDYRYLFRSYLEVLNDLYRKKYPKIKEESQR